MKGDIDSFHLRYRSMISTQRLKSYECYTFLTLLCLVRVRFVRNPRFLEETFRDRDSLRLMHFGQKSPVVHRPSSTQRMSQRGSPYVLCSKTWPAGHEYTMIEFTGTALGTPKGPFIKDVRTKGGGGVSPKADIVREVAWIYSYRCSKNADKGGRGSKIPKILRTSFMYGP